MSEAYGNEKFIIKLKSALILKQNEGILRVNTLHLFKDNKEYLHIVIILLSRTNRKMDSLLNILPQLKLAFSILVILLHFICEFCPKTAK